MEESPLAAIPSLGLSGLTAGEGLATPLPWVGLSHKPRRRSSNWIQIGQMPAAIFYLPYNRGPNSLGPLNGSEEAPHAQDYQG